MWSLPRSAAPPRISRASPFLEAICQGGPREAELLLHPCGAGTCISGSGTSTSPSPHSTPSSELQGMGVSPTSSSSAPTAAWAATSAGRSAPSARQAGVRHREPDHAQPLPVSADAPHRRPRRGWPQAAASDVPPPTSPSGKMLAWIATCSKTCTTPAVGKYVSCMTPIRPSWKAPLPRRLRERQPGGDQVVESEDLPDQAACRKLCTTASSSPAASATAASKA